MIETNILRFTWKHSKRAQVWILCIVLFSMPTYFMALDLPKQIVNGPILGGGYEIAGAEQPFLRLVFEYGGEEYLLFEGFQLERLGMLFALSGLFLTLILANGLFKYYINTYKGRLGERMLRRVRFFLVDRLLRFPVRQFYRIKSSEVSSMVKDEVEPIGGFMGDAFVQPLLLGGQALTAMAFIMVQNFWLGLIALAVIAIQFILIPRMRRHLLRLGKQRQITARALAGRVGEIVDGITNVHVNDTSHYERADISNRLAKIFFIRFELYQRKFFTKFLNNLLSQITPFLFYVIGGYFALQGRLDVGQLVAVIAAFKDVPGPIKELLDWDQQRLDVQVKFSQVAEQFDVEDVLDEEQQKLPQSPVPNLPFPVEVSNLSVSDDSGATLLERISLKIGAGEKIALIGPTNSGADVLADTLVRLHIPQTGSVSYGDADMLELNESQLGRRIGYAAGDIYFFQGTLRDSLLYALKHQPVEEKVYEGPEALDRDRFVFEAEQTSNTPLDVNADWLNLRELVDADSRSVAVHNLVSLVLGMCALKEDIFNFGLRGVVDPESNPVFTDKILEARKRFRENMAESKVGGLIELFDPDRYADQATIAENLLFGTPIGGIFASENLADNKFLRSILREVELEELLVAKGLELAETTVGIMQDLQPGHEFFDQISFMDSESLPEYQLLIKRAKSTDIEELDANDRTKLIEMTFTYIEPQHRMGLVDDNFRQQVLKARRLFQEKLPVDLQDAISFYNPETYNAAASVQDNLLMGRIVYGRARGPQRVQEAVSNLLADMDLKEALVDIGLEYDIGSGGKRLTKVQRQKLGVARALIKQPDLLILNRALSSLDAQQQADIVKDILAFLEKQQTSPAIICVAAQTAVTSLFEHVYLFSGSSLVESGRREELANSGGEFAKLMAG